MNTKPHIIITSLDAERLEILLDSLPKDAFPGKADLEDELERAQIVDPREVPGTVVTMNSKVKFRIQPSGEEFCLTLVYPGTPDAEGKTISILAPVGSALLGLSQGDEIQWPRPGGGCCGCRSRKWCISPSGQGSTNAEGSGPSGNPDCMPFGTIGQFDWQGCRPGVGKHETAWARAHAVSGRCNTGNYLKRYVMRPRVRS